MGGIQEENGKRVGMQEDMVISFIFFYLFDNKSRFV
jgi:hypothetical protein